MIAAQNLFISLCLALASAPAAVSAQQAVPAPAPQGPAARDGRHDFDFEFGTWTTELRYLRNPLTGAPPQWADYRGTSIVRPVMGGRANLVELSVEGPGRIEGISLRLYNARAQQWTLNFAGMGSGTLTAPMTGAFDAAGRGLFFGQDVVDGRTVLVRFVISEVTRNSARFEQAYSLDAGATWEVNWIAVDTRR